MITADQVLAISPGAMHLDIYLAPLNEAMREFEINNAARVRYFLSNLFEESASFKYMQEIADGSAYEGRKDLGNIFPGDGKKYKGRGPIQITGRDTYKACGLALGLDLVSKPELLESPEYAFKAAAWFWAKYKSINKYADMPEDKTFLYRGKTLTKFQWITLLVNGGSNGIDVRRAFYNKALIAIK